ncbi:hypothetical protein BH24GEM3_BH24GEM3_23500 [soil metagenome]|jgi:hypothetical protein|nr:hypothetical protein [Gemmatimonadota bacterium]
MDKQIEALIRESQRPPRAAEVVVRLSNGERWSFDKDSQLFTPDGRRVAFHELAALLVLRAVPYVTYRGRWIKQTDSAESWKQAAEEEPREGRCEVDFLTDQIVRVSRLYKE